MDNDNIHEQVHNQYGTLARGAAPTHSSAIAQAFGYSKDDLKSIPQEANLGVSCGNPLALATLRDGETVIDLGSGAGLDVFLAANKVGPEGRAIGIDFDQMGTKGHLTADGDMLAKARKNQATTPSLSNVSFVKGNITSVPLDDGIADCIISNCVINLVPLPEKPLVFKEMGRLLKRGGRVAVSDILARKGLPEKMRESISLYVGCVAGASAEADYMRWLEGHGFGDIVIIDTKSDLNVYADMAKSAKSEEARAPCWSTGEECRQVNGCGAGNGEVELGDVDINEWAGSFKIFAVKK